MARGRSADASRLDLEPVPRVRPSSSDVSISASLALFGIAIMALALLTLSGAALELDSSNFDKEVSRRPSQFVLPDRRNSALQNCAPCKRHLQKFTRSRHRSHPQVFKSGKSAFIKFLAPW